MSNEKNKNEMPKVERNRVFMDDLYRKWEEESGMPLRYLKLALKTLPKAIEKTLMFPGDYLTIKELGVFEKKYVPGTSRQFFGGTEVPIKARVKTTIKSKMPHTLVEDGAVVHRTKKVDLGDAEANDFLGDWEGDF